MRILRLDVEGNDVRDWQNFLRKQGFDLGRIDGQFGPKTEQATKDFQAREGLESDGIVGDASVSAAKAAGFAPSPDAPTSQPAGVPGGSFAKTLKAVFNRGT